MERKFEEWRRKLAGWVAAVSRNSSSVHCSDEELRQEADIQLWRCLGRYGAKADDEVVKLFKAAFTNSIVSLIRRARRGHTVSTAQPIEEVVDLRHEQKDWWYQQKIEELKALAEDPELRQCIVRGMDVNGGTVKFGRKRFSALKSLALRVI